MFGAALPSEPPPPKSEADLPAYVRAAGAIKVTCHAREGRTSAATVRQEGALRIRFPNSHGPHLEATLINVAGGAAGGDHFKVSIEAMAGANVVVSTPAAEKIYRAIEAPAVVETALVAAAGTRLAWLPQETILFDRSRLVRRLNVNLAPDATLTLSEMTILGRTDMGEALVSGAFQDQWRVRRGTRLIYAEATRLDGPIASILEKSAVGAGARAFATVLRVSPDAEAMIDRAREKIANFANTGCEAGVSAYDGMIVARFIGQTGFELRRAVTHYLGLFDDLVLPRVWNS